MALVLALLALAGCDDDATTPSPTATTPDRPVRPAELPERLRDDAFGAQLRITAYCGRLRAALQGGARPPSKRERARAFAAADLLVELSLARPFDLVQTGVDVRLYTSDIAEDLEGANCDPALIAKLEEAG